LVNANIPSRPQQVCCFFCFVLFFFGWFFLFLFFFVVEVCCFFFFGVFFFCFFGCCFLGGGGGVFCGLLFCSVSLPDPRARPAFEKSQQTSNAQASANRGSPRAATRGFSCSNFLPAASPQRCRRPYPAEIAPRAQRVRPIQGNLFTRLEILSARVNRPPPRIHEVSLIASEICCPG